MYLRPSLPYLEAELLPILSRDPSLIARTVIGADFNARSALWNSNCSNSRGHELESLLARFPLNIANVPVSSLAFIPPETSFIDVTLTGHKVPIEGWHFPDAPSLSDHPFISFNGGVTSSPSCGRSRAF
jgi:Endonuclease-reverse transcriptase